MEKADAYCGFVNCVNQLLKNGMTYEVLSVLHDENNQAAFLEGSWELIPIISDYLTQDSLEKNRQMFECCEAIVDLIADRCLPEEALLEFIGQAEECDSAKFIVMLKAMNKSLLKVKSNKVNSLNWCLNTILRHLYDMPTPEDLHLEGEERLLLDHSSSVDNMKQVINCVIGFIDSFIIDINSYSEEGEVPHRNSILTTLIKLFGKPFAYMDLEVLKSKSDFRIYADELMDKIYNFKTDMLIYLDYVDIGKYVAEETVQTVVDSEFTNTSLAVYYYLIFHEGIKLEDTPCVYNAMFILDKCIKLSATLLSYSHSLVQKKGLLLAHAVVKRVESRALRYNEYDYTMYSKFVETLAGIMIYCEYKEIRQTAVKVFNGLLDKFDSKGRYVVVLNIQDVIPHPVFVGYLATVVKDILANALLSETDDLEFFTGKYLLDMLFKFCRVKGGIEGDLLEQSDQIISSINLLRFLVIRDVNNTTGVWKALPKLSTEYLDTLQKGIEISKAHYELQKKEIVNFKMSNQISVTVGTGTLPEMPRERKLEVLNSALNKFDLMESLLCRLNECIEINQK